MIRARVKHTTSGRAAFVAAVFVVAAPVQAEAQSLRGSPASMDRQNRVARSHDFSYLRTGSRVLRFVEQGYLVPIRANQDYDLHAVSYPYARPEIGVFVRRLASQYRDACGEKLVVTSLTRPTSRQPRNASSRSVHPTGMAIDLRYSSNRSCRRWLENVLMSLEKARVLEATRERYPPHYHVAVFPNQYSAYVARQGGSVAQTTRVAVRPQAPATTTPAPARTAPAPSSRVEYEVRSGDSLWTIARRHGTTVDEIRAANNLRGSRIIPGQVLEVPRAR